jgi:hypothetical protein
MKTAKKDDKVTKASGKKTMVVAPLKNKAAKNICILFKETKHLPFLSSSRYGYYHWSSGNDGRNLMRFKCKMRKNPNADSEPNKAYMEKSALEWANIDIKQVQSALGRWR